MKTATVLIFFFTISLSNMHLQEHKEKTQQERTSFASYPAGPKEDWATKERSNSADYETASSKPEAGRYTKPKKNIMKDQANVNTWPGANVMFKDFFEAFKKMLEMIQNWNNKCYRVPERWPTCLKVSQQDKKHLADALTELGFLIYKTISLHSQEDNFVFSPLSISALLSQLLLGTRGETKDQLEEALQYPKDFTCVHEALKKILTSRPFLSASQIFIHPDMKLYESFLEQSDFYYGIRPQKLTNDSAKNVQMVNNWISEYTNHKIPELVDDVSPDVQMILLNAVYFHSTWKTVFNKSETENKEFFKTKDKVILVPTMTSEKYELASTTDHLLHAKVGRFRLSDSSSVIIIMPQSISQQLSVIEAKLTLPIFLALIKKLQKTSFRETIVSLPKFKVDFKQDLMPIMETLGIMETVTSPNLCGMSNQAGLFLTDAKHRAVLELNEEGVEAAAASSITLSRTASFFEVNQPFLVVIWDDQLAYPIFIGRVQDPSIKA
ncbi:plasma protease C1 inhibitor [Protopterus annectens]|uniref:plasma protease C1 inhibitor n=1 Tax=Protopterus annectens TaxID=7888 RepID=UPI001CF9FE9D|nr:plasma protease C1 inhibitor [Protopterus annectens]